MNIIWQDRDDDECIHLGSEGFTQLHTSDKTNTFPVQTRQHPLGAPVPLGAFPTQGGWHTPASPVHLFHLTASSLDEKCMIPVHCKPNASVPRVSSAINFGYSGAPSTDLYRISCWPEWKNFSYLVSNRVLETFESQELPQKNTVAHNAKNRLLTRVVQALTLLMHLKYICIP